MVLYCARGNGRGRSVSMRASSQSRRPVQAARCRKTLRSRQGVREGPSKALEAFGARGSEVGGRARAVRRRARRSLAPATVRAPPPPFPAARVKSRVSRHFFHASTAVYYNFGVLIVIHDRKSQVKAALNAPLKSSRVRFNDRYNEYAPG